MDFIKLSKEEIMQLIIKAATINEETIALDTLTDEGMFCCGNPHRREIMLVDKAFWQVIEVLQPIVTFNPNWGNNIGKVITQAFFEVDIFGKKYKVFCLIKERKEATA